MLGLIDGGVLENSYSSVYKAPKSLNSVCHVSELSQQLKDSLQKRRASNRSFHA
jgi:hypothetical protein